jgi:hypothetical protein
VVKDSSGKRKGGERSMVGEIKKFINFFIDNAIEGYL